MGKRTNTAVWMEKQSRWQIKVQKDGERRTFYSSKKGRAGQREANAKADAWLDEGIGKVQRFEKAWELFIADQKGRVSASALHPIQSAGDVWILPAVGNKKLDSVTEAHLQQIINAAHQSGKAKKTLLNIRATLKAFYKFCRKAKLSTMIPEDIMIPQSAPKIGKEILQPEHLRLLIEESRRDPDLAPYVLQALTGLRPGELLGLRKSDRRGNYIFVQRSINERGEITAGKTENARRRVLLVGDALTAWDSICRETDENDLFLGVSQKAYRNRIVRFCRNHDLGYTVTPYGLRHTFVSIAKTLPAGLVKEQVGHSVSMDTYGVYGHAVAADEAMLGAALQGAFSALLE